MHIPPYFRETRTISGGTDLPKLYISKLSKSAAKKSKYHFYAYCYAKSEVIARGHEVKCMKKHHSDFCRRQTQSKHSVTNAHYHLQPIFIHYSPCPSPQQVQQTTSSCLAAESHWPCAGQLNG